MDCGCYASPIGWVQVTVTSAGVASLQFVDESAAGVKAEGILGAALSQLEEYFTGKRRTFDLPLALAGTDFQRAVWQHLLTIPYGQTTSYGEVAQAIGRPMAVRAAGAANGRNPIAIIVPCHRVVGADGSLTGYGGGLWRKEWLLRHEGARLT